jgi:hypothetical protein
MLDALPRLPVGCSGSWWYSKNQTAIFAPLTRVNRPHHRANGFDQARDLDRAGPSNPWVAPLVTELTLIVVILSQITGDAIVPMVAIGTKCRIWMSAQRSLL